MTQVVDREAIGNGTDELEVDRTVSRHASYAAVPDPPIPLLVDDAGPRPTAVTT
jgi:hypothetical protein